MTPAPMPYAVQRAIDTLRFYAEHDEAAALEDAWNRRAYNPSAWRTNMEVARMAGKMCDAIMHLPRNQDTLANLNPYVEALCKAVARSAGLTPEGR